MTATILGAYGAHRTYPKDSADELKMMFDTANRYHFFHSLALLSVPLCKNPKIVSILNLIRYRCGGISQISHHTFTIPIQQIDNTYLTWVLGWNLIHIGDNFIFWNFIPSSVYRRRYIWKVDTYWRKHFNSSMAFDGCLSDFCKLGKLNHSICFRC